MKSFFPDEYTNDREKFLKKAEQFTKMYAEKRPSDD